MAPQGELERVGGGGGGGGGGVAHSEQLEVRGAPHAWLERVGAAPLPQLERVGGGGRGVWHPRLSWSGWGVVWGRGHPSP